jgi:DtxR family Mn-dependent transcriptional regulator
MASSTVEDYVKQLYLEQQTTKSELVPMGQLATAMGVTPGTATSMIKALSDAGLVHYEPRAGVRLSRGGIQLALHVLRRHRLVEQLLVEVLGLDWAEVHVEAERLEHAISDRVLARIDEVLGHPEVDPHGDPIPSARGRLAEGPADSLAECLLNEPVFVSRILDQDPEFLRFADRNGLVPGARATVVSRDPSADAISVDLDHGTIVLGPVAAAKILVEGAVPQHPG